MPKRTLKVALLAVLSVVLVLGMSTVALADQTWSDLPDTVTAKYGVTDNQVAAISDGYAGGLWKPFQSVTRAQFTKMAVAAFNIPLTEPATPSFTDVPKSNYYYPYIEGAKAAAVVNGVSATSFAPNALITRQQALAIVSRYVARAAGYDLATMYTADEVNQLLTHFGDAAKISAELKSAMAFAYDFGITVGNDYGNLDPLANLTRIQGAAMLIRAQAKVPPAHWTAAAISLVSEDKSENLIGQTRSITFEVTDAAGHPAIGVLVDFDTMFANPLYVGNISPQAALTNNYGQVTVNLLSTEPGTQRVTASVAGVGMKLTTAYWLALDEVYFLTEDLEGLEKNVGDTGTTELCARVLVMGPGPRSTSQLDWYNWISKAPFDPTNVKQDDGVDGPDDDAKYADELSMDKQGFLPRTLAGIDVEWKLVNIKEAVPASGSTPAKPAVPSVGSIVKVDGAAVTATTAAVGKTDSAGKSCVTLYSEKIGQTKVQAVATYAGNPYPKLLFNHDTVGDDWWHDYDWDEQPAQYFLMTWIPHVIGGDTGGPITPAYALNNTGEMEIFTLELKDEFGNPIKDYTVRWTLQGVGYFKSDGSTTVGIAEENVDIDVTGVDGKASVMVESLVPGESVIHCKVMDKYGLPWKEWNVVKQWYSIDEVVLGYVDSKGVWQNSAANPVNSSHTWIAKVSGAKLVHVLWDVNRNGKNDDVALLAPKADLKAAEGFVMKWVDATLRWVHKPAGEEVLPGQVFKTDQYEDVPRYTCVAHLELGPAEYLADKAGVWEGKYTEVGLKDNIREVWSYLAGKTVYFFTNIGTCGQGPTSDVPLPVRSGTGFPEFVGSITSATSGVTDAKGEAAVTINSTNKGVQYTFAVADYLANPQDGDPLKPTKWGELRAACATKTWTADAGDSWKIFAQGEGVLGDRWVNPVLPWEQGEDNPNTETIAIQVFDKYGNALEGYKVEWQLVGLGETTMGATRTYHPLAHFEAANHTIGTGEAQKTARVGDTNIYKDDNPKWDYDDALAAAGNNPVWGWVTPLGYDTLDYDGDLAWGYTENHEINFKLNLASAANVTLVLDETLGELQARQRQGEAQHFTSLVNINIYKPNGDLWASRLVTKVWDINYTLVIGRIEVAVGETATGPWTTTLNSALEMLYAKVTCFDQYGNVVDETVAPFNAHPLLWLLSGEGNTWGGAAVSGVTSFAIHAAGTYNYIVYWDVDGDGLLSAGDVQSNVAKIIRP